MKLASPKMEGSPAKGPIKAVSCVEADPPGVASTVVIGFAP
jgi:hypothetical protein